MYDIIGKEVTVTVDRALGTVHPRHPDIYYSVNYGYIEGVMALDGEEQDAYILGVEEPVEKFTGIVIAVVNRKNDVEDKWVVAPYDVTFTREEIFEKIYFQEKYFISEVIMSENESREK